MIETMNEQHTYFAIEIKACSLLHEVDPILPFLRLEASHYDDCESFLFLESNVVDDTHLTDIEEVFVRPLTSLPLVATSFLALPYPLALVT